MTPPCTIAHRILAICIATMLLVGGGGLTGASVLCLSMDGHVKIEAMRSTCCEPGIPPSTSSTTPCASDANHCASCTDLIVSPTAHQRKLAKGDSPCAANHGHATLALDANGTQTTVTAHTPFPGAVAFQRNPASDIVQLI